MVIVDWFTKYAVAVPCKQNLTALEAAKIIYRSWYLKGYGWPSSFVSDRDPLFVSQTWDEFCGLLGITKEMSTSRHQQTDGQTESIIKALERGLAKIVNHTGSDSTPSIRSYFRL